MSGVTRVLTVVLALCALALPAAAASSSQRLGLSWDGRSWAAELGGTLFNRAGSVGRWVPGDTDAKTFYVRNQGGDDARLAVDYLLPAGHTVVPGDFTIAAQVDGGGWQQLAPGIDWVVLSRTPVSDRQSIAVQVKATFDPASTNESQSEQFPLRFRVTLTEIAGPGAQTGPNGGAAAGDGGLLPNTGAPEVRWLVGLGLFCLGGGTAIVVSSRRKGRDAEAS